MFKQTPNAMQNGSSSLRPQPTQAYDTSRCSLLHHKSPSKAHGRDTVHCTWTDVNMTHMTFVGILASIRWVRWVPGNAYFSLQSLRQATHVCLGPNFSGDSGSRCSSHSCSRDESPDSIKTGSHVPCAKIGYNDSAMIKREILKLPY